MKPKQDFEKKVRPLLSKVNAFIPESAAEDLLKDRFQIACGYVLDHLDGALTENDYRAFELCFTYWADKLEKLHK